MIDITQVTIFRFNEDAHIHIEFEEVFDFGVSTDSDLNSRLPAVLIQVAILAKLPVTVMRSFLRMRISIVKVEYYNNEA